jgi:hypothetical protein
MGWEVSPLSAPPAGLSEREAEMLRLEAEAAKSLGPARNNGYLPVQLPPYGPLRVRSVVHIDVVL